MDEPRRSGLRDARRDRGWTQEEAADQLARLAWVRRSERVGVNADMIAKWERGDKSPSARYRELLCLLYGATPEYLGIARLTKTRTSSLPEPASSAVTERTLVDALGGAAAILDQLGTAFAAENRDGRLVLLDVPGQFAAARHIRQVRQ